MTKRIDLAPLDVDAFNAYVRDAEPVCAWCARRFVAGDHCRLVSDSERRSDRDGPQFICGDCKP